MNLYHKVYTKWQHLLNYDRIRSKYNGYTIFYHKNDALINEVNKVTSRIYEEEESAVMCALLEKMPSPRMLDIGANIGLMSLNVLRRVPNVHIYAFEPGPHQWTYLERNINHNKLGSSIEALNVAFGRTSGKVKFYSHGEVNSSGDGFVDTGRAGDSIEIEVDCLTLDDWWTGKGRVPIHLVKIDTEGAELDVLAGGSEFLKSCKPKMLVEICHMNYKKYNLTFDDYFDFFERIGYVLYDLNNQRISKGYTDETTHKYTYLAVDANESMV